MNLVDRYKPDIRTQDILIGMKLIITKTRGSVDLCEGDIVIVTGKESCHSEHCPDCKPKYALFVHCDRTNNKIQHVSCRYDFKTIDGRIVV